VIEVRAIARTTDDVTETSRACRTARVLFSQGGAACGPWDERLRLIDVKDVLATVEEFVPTRRH